MRVAFKGRVNLMDFPSWIAQFGPKVPLETLVEEVNNIYHSFDASRYDREHPEIHRQLSPIWDQMIARLPKAQMWSVLDFGCGTGFEANLLLSRLGDKVAKLIAYDPSPEMTAICRIRLEKFPQAAFCARMEQVHSCGPFNLLITNSLLHHLPNIGETINSLLSNLTSDAVWLAGHEPSARFYRNGECLNLLEGYHLYHKRAKWLEVGNYITKASMLFGNHPLRATACAAHKRGLFLERPSALAIDKIVDFHVAHSVAEVIQGRGLDIENMQASFQRDWVLDWSKTYSFLGPHPYASAPDKWVEKARLLESRFPADGANFCMVWQRRHSSTNSASTRALI
jgi:SAM-dependent methyltransferase